MKNSFTLENIFSLLEQADIFIYEYEEDNKLCGYELNTYTCRGVNQLIFLDFRDTKLDPENPESFFDIFSNRITEIDIDEEIELHRESENYKKHFSIRESLEDFEGWKENLQTVAYKINALK
jgi:hypothetical protein